jgi:hypothetical protein
LLVKFRFFVVEVDLKGQIYATYLFVNSFVIDGKLELDLLGHVDASKGEFSAEDDFLFGIISNGLFDGNRLEIEQTLVFKVFEILLDLIIGFDQNSIFIFTFLVSF